MLRLTLNAQRDGHNINQNTKALSLEDLLPKLS